MAIILSLQDLATIWRKRKVSLSTLNLRSKLITKTFCESSISCYCAGAVTQGCPQGEHVSDKCQQCHNVCGGSLPAQDETEMLE